MSKTYGLRTNLYNEVYYLMEKVENKLIKHKNNVKDADKIQARLTEAKDYLNKNPNDLGYMSGLRDWLEKILDVFN